MFEVEYKLSNETFSAMPHRMGPAEMYTYDRVKKFVYEIFVKIGCPGKQAETAADVLTAADLRGVDSHGVSRLDNYVRLWEVGRINAAPAIKITHETPGTACLDGDRGLGLVVAPAAMELAVAKARKVGTGWVAVKNSNHFGIAGYHAMLALEHDMIGIAMCNTSPLVAPTFSAEKLLGTNPIAIAIPAGMQPPFVADFATTPVAYGKIEMQMQKGEDIPPGWMQDADGRPTTDAHTAKKGGALLPLGSDRVHGSHKGYCLSASVDILSAVLPGAGYGPWAPPFLSYLPLPEDSVGDGIGHFFGAIRIDAFRPVAEFKSHMDNWICRFRRAKPVQGQPQVLIPGDPEREIAARRETEGIPLLEPVVRDLQRLSQKFSIEF